MSSQELFEKLTRLAHGATLKVRVRSALNPALWMSGIIAPTCFGFAFLFEGTSQVALLVTGILPIAIACGGYVYFALKDPDKLQSEDYQLRKQALELIEERGSRIAVAATSVEAITNPLLRELGTGERDE